MNKELENVVARSDAKFEQINAHANARVDASIARIEKTVREETRWFAAIVFSSLAYRLLRNHDALQVNASVRTNALQTQKRKTNEIGSTGRPAAAKGGSVPPLR
jgi:hypothetical protein